MAHEHAPTAHPPGLRVLFFTEMWERFSYYGMRALLVLFMVDSVSRGGLGFDEKTATGIFGLYTAGVYLAALPGGWIADRLLGSRRAVELGGWIIAAGHFTLAIPHRTAFYLGLMLVVSGTGLLKPNVSTLVGELYPEGGARRDAGFTWFYMGINLGAALGPLVCSLLGEKLDWHYGFAAAGIGMLLGLARFRLRSHRLGGAGEPPDIPEPTRRRTRTIAGCGLAVILVPVVAALGGVLPVDPLRLARASAVGIALLAVAWFSWAFAFAGLDRRERGRLVVVALLFFASTVFWSGFEQTGSSLNLFADRHTLRTVPWTGFEVPTGWFQSLGAILVIVFAPVVAASWSFAGRRGIDVPIVAKIACGLLFLAAGFLVIAVGARRAVASGPVWPTWLLATYLLHTWGELLLSPVGLSAVTQLSPRRLAGQMMGVWFLATSLGNLLAGLLAGEATSDASRAMAARFRDVAGMAAGIGLLLLLVSRVIQRRLVSPRETQRAPTS